MVTFTLINIYATTEQHREGTGYYIGHSHVCSQVGWVITVHAVTVYFTLINTKRQNSCHVIALQG